MILFIYLLTYFLLVFVIRSARLKLKKGVNPFTFNFKDDVHSYNGKVLSVTSLMELIVVGIYAFKTEWYKYLLPFWYIESDTLVIIGWGFLIVSLIVVWVAQSQMSNSWRIGIDEKNKTKLVTKGLFSISRNPIFLGIIIANVGLFLVIPNAFTLLINTLSTISINTQIRLEEEFLKQEFGNTYLEYAKKVQRWI